MRISVGERLVMSHDYNPRSPRKPVSLRINVDLLRKARELDINLSATLERALVESLKQECSAHWLTENRLAINEYNKHVEKHGTFGGHLSSL